MLSAPEKPLSRKEKYLSAIAGITDEVPACPYSREEAYLAAILENGGGGGGGPTVVQEMGQSTTAVMSQKAVTDVVGDIETALHIINNGGNS